MYVYCVCMHIDTLYCSSIYVYNILTAIIVVTPDLRDCSKLLTAMIVVGVAFHKVFTLLRMQL